jgi:disulfide bond formation protein DsbB
MRLLPARLLPAMAALISLLTMSYVWFAQHVEGYVPCHLCLLQRKPHEAAIIVGLLAAFSWARQRSLAVFLLFVLLVLYLVGAGIAGYHAGVEQQWWEGPTSCSAGASGAQSLAELKAMVLAAPVTRCEDIQWTFLGLSMAAWNFLLSLALAGTIIAALKARFAEKS